MEVRLAFTILNKVLSGLNGNRFKEIFGESRGDELHKIWIRNDLDFMRLYNNALSGNDKRNLHNWIQSKMISETH